MDEFLGYANKDIFNVDEEWKPLEERDGKIILSPQVHFLCLFLYFCIMLLMIVNMLDTWINAQPIES